MSSAAPNHPYDRLGLDAPFAEGAGGTDLYEAGPTWNELAESPYAEAPATIAPQESLAWLDMESAGTQDFDEQEQDHAQEGQLEEPADAAEYVDDEERDASESLVGSESSISTISGFGRYRSDVAALAPAERAKIAALAAQVLWSFGPDRTPVRSIELTGHADRDAARGPAFESTMSRERALNARAALAEAIDRQSTEDLSAEPPSPPFSTRLHWRVVPRGATQLQVPNPRTEVERARNRRVEIALRPADVTPARRLAFATGSPGGESLEWTFPFMLRFSKIVPADINATNCCKAVQTASRLLAESAPPRQACSSFNFYGSQLVTAREGQAPLSATRKCCQWTGSYWQLCRTEPGRSGCAHCGDVPGPHLVLKYAKQELQKAVDRIKLALDQGCTVAAGVLSGICADKPDVGCARTAKSEAWRQCPEHWLLIIGYHQDTFLFWDSSKASALQTREGHHFGLLEYDRDAPRLSTARAVAGADRLAVDTSGFHILGYPSVHSQKRYQVLDLRNSAPCSAWDAARRCGEYTAEGRFLTHACPSQQFDREDVEHEAHESCESCESCREDEAATDGTARLSAPQQAWVLALERSALERLPDVAERARFAEQDWSDVEFPGNVPRGQTATDEIRRHWLLARSLFNAMAGLTPERRVPATIRFHDRPAVSVPGQPSQRLFAEARDAFLRMQAAAKTDGVSLAILSSWRSRARQAAASANQPNPAAVARKASAHMYGLAIDLRMGVPGLPVKEINTRVDRATAAKVGTAAKMGNLVRMYRSPVYKWMSLRASEFGWYPYRNEPWHWEYNPPGLKERFEGATRGDAEEDFQGEEGGTVPPALLRTFTAKALGVRVAVYVTQAARNARQVEMMVFAHGLDLCKPVLSNRPATFITGRPFILGDLVEAAGRPIVLVVPFLDWERLDANRMAFGRKWHRLAQPASFNQVAAEALEQVRAITGSAAPPTTSRLILAGHSRAYGFFDALAHEHDAPDMRTGALASPLHVWALDTTYSAPIADWRAWLRSREDIHATVVYRHGTYRTRDSGVRELATGVRGKEFVKLAAASSGRLVTVPVAAGKVSHCGIPAAYLPELLAALPAISPAREQEAEGSYEAFEEDEDYAGIATEADAFESEEQSAEGEELDDEDLDSQLGPEERGELPGSPGPGNEPEVGEDVGEDLFAEDEQSRRRMHPLDAVKTDEWSIAFLSSVGGGVRLPIIRAGGAIALFDLFNRKTNRAHRMSIMSAGTVTGLPVGVSFRDSGYVKFKTKVPVSFHDFNHRNAELQLKDRVGKSWRTVTIYGADRVGKLMHVEVNNWNLTGWHGFSGSGRTEILFSNGRPAGNPDYELRLDLPSTEDIPVGFQVSQQDYGLVIRAPGDVLFDFDRDVLHYEAAAHLSQIIEYINRLPAQYTRILVEGHTDDAEKTPGYNMALSKRRAKRVLDYFIDNKWAFNRDYTFDAARGLGANQPIVPNRNPDGTVNSAGRAKNRRVEIFLFRTR